MGRNLKLSTTVQTARISVHIINKLHLCMVFNKTYTILFAPLNTNKHWMLHLYGKCLATVWVGPQVWRTTSDVEKCSGWRDLIASCVWRYETLLLKVRWVYHVIKLCKILSWSSRNIIAKKWRTICLNEDYYLLCFVQTNIQTCRHAWPGGCCILEQCTYTLLLIKQNSTYRRQWISRCLQITALIQFFYVSIVTCHKSYVNGSKVTAILLKGWISPIGGASAVEGLRSTGLPRLVTRYPNTLFSIATFI